jgi:HD superfamily phosphohydrolase
LRLQIKLKKTVSPSPINKRKIVNDPVHGFITIPDELVFDLMEHPYFQRLRRIKQLGLTHFVYPGATHTRFQHALGAVHLMGQAIGIIRSKGHEISDEEAEATAVAILLHDIGHGPFSHALESSFLGEIKHEQVSAVIMDRLNKEFNGRLSMALEVFRGEYPKKFLTQLVSSQLDMDRLDYLKRDSFYTGVTEGVIGSDRIIKMLDVLDDELVVEAKGIYSIEKFLIARRLMYWQVYLHKSVLSAENLLVMILRRARELALNGSSLFTTPSLHYFLYNQFPDELLSNNNYPGWDDIIANFTQLDDDDILVSAKVWTKHEDKVLALLCSNFINRNLFKIKLQNSPFDDKVINEFRKKAADRFDIDLAEAAYFVISDSISNNTYSASDERIKILYKDGTVKDITEASDMLNLAVLSKVVKKYFLAIAKEL